MSRTLFVGFDTSNYTTSAAVCDGSGRVICNSRILLPVREGERGLRQSDAVFHHVRNLPRVLSDVREAVKDGTVLAVGCSVSRRAEDSYMPCFLSGMAAAEAFAAALRLPVVQVSHQEGHIMAALYSAGAERLLSGSGFASSTCPAGRPRCCLSRRRRGGLMSGLSAARSICTRGRRLTVPA